MQHVLDLPADVHEGTAHLAAAIRSCVEGNVPFAEIKGLCGGRGIAAQKQEGTFMIRVRIPSGVLTVEQAQALVRIARQCSDGSLHVTTRQDIQIHNVELGDAPAVLQQLAVVGLTTKGAGGDGVRNVATCPYAGLCPNEVFDTIPTGQALAAYMLGRPGEFALPRKYKIAFSGCAADCALAGATDLGFVATVADGASAYSVFAGGGMGRTPREADVIYESLPAAEAVEVAEALRRVFDRLGDRSNRARARIRYLVEEMGVDAFRTEVEAERSRIRVTDVPRCPVPELDSGASARASVMPSGPPFEKRCGPRVLPQRHDGLVAVPVRLPLGWLTPDDLDTAARLAETFSQTGTLRCTRDQDIVIPSVAVDDVPRLVEALSGWKSEAVAPGALGAFVSCVGAPLCRTGQCESQSLARSCAAALAEAGLDGEALEDIQFRVSGCHNCCAHHLVAPVGLYGRMTGRDGTKEAVYTVVIGSRVGAEGTRFGTAVGEVPEAGVPAYVVALVVDFVRSRHGEESFREYAGRLGVERFRGLLQG